MTLFELQEYALYHNAECVIDGDTMTVSHVLDDGRVCTGYLDEPADWIQPD